MTISIKKPILIAFLAIVFIAFTGCSGDETPESYIVTAEEYMKNKKSNHAVVSLKIALKLAPNNIKARELLGQVYFNIGQSLIAEKEIRKALALGGREAVLIPLLAEILMFHSDYEGVIELSSTVKGSILEQIKIYQALSLFYVSELSNHLEIITQLKSSENTHYQAIGKLLEAINEKNHDTTQKIIFEIGQKEAIPEVLFFLGKLYLHYKDYEQAIFYFKKYQNDRISDLKTNLFLAKSELERENYKEAELLADAVLKLVPNQSFANYIKAFLLYKNNNYKQSIYHADKAIQNGFVNNTSHIIAGLSNFALNQFESAYEHFKQVKNNIPKNHPVYRIIVITEVKIGKLDEATESVLNMDDSTQNYSKVLLSMSDHFLKLGKYKNAKEILKKVGSIDDISSVELSKIGLMKLSLDDISGLKDIEKVVQNDPESIEYRLMLISAYIHQGQLNKALVVAKNVVNKAPKKVIGYNLTGSLLVKLNKYSEAKKYFDKGLLVNPQNILSFMFKALLAENKNDYELAYKYIEKVLEINPEYLDGILNLYRLSKQKNNTAEVIEKIKSIALKFNDNREISVAYAAILIKENQAEQASNYLLHLKRKKSIDASIELLLGDSYVKQGKWHKAKSIYTNILKQQPNNSLAFNRLVSVLDNMSQFDEALHIIKTMEIHTQNIDYLYIMKGYFLTKTLKYQDAVDTLKLVSPASQNLKQYKGIFTLAKLGINNEDVNIDDIKKAYEENPSSTYALAISSYYETKKQENLAISFLTQHVNAHERSYGALMVLANLISDEKPDLAIEYYQKALEGHPAHVVVLNNLAWLYLQKNDLEEAVKYIERAIRVAPKTVAILDTYAEILLATGDAEKSVNIYESIEAKMSLTDGQLRLYAKALITLGKTDEAHEKLKGVKNK